MTVKLHIHFTRGEDEANFIFNNFPREELTQTVANLRRVMKLYTLESVIIESAEDGWEQIYPTRDND